MTWLAPWAWAGLVLLALPVVIHLLGRSPTRRLVFPSLRFIETSRLLPVRISALHDPGLLLLRLLILTAAVAALARPRLPTPIDPTATPPLVRAVIVDTSHSMQRSTPTGGSAMEEGKRLAAQIAADAAVARTIATISPTTALAGTAAWLAQQAGTRELVIVSDFQLGAIDSLALASIPADIGIRLVPVAITPGEVQDREVYTGSSRLRIRSTETGWDIQRDSVAAFLVPWIGGDLEEPQLKALETAGAQPPLATPIDTTLVPALGLRRSDTPYLVPPFTPGVADYLLRLAREPLLAEAARYLPPMDSLVPEVPVLLRDPLGRPVAQLGAVLRQVPDQVFIWTNAPVENPGVVLASAAMRLARSLAPPPTELLSEVIPTATLATWERVPGNAGPPASSTPGEPVRSDGRWLWGMALLLLGAEALWRRQIAAQRTTAEVPDAA